MIDFGFRKENGPRTNLFLGIGFVAILLCLWEILTSIGLIGPVFLPSPVAVIVSTYELFVELSFLSDIMRSVSRVCTGYILSIAFAVPLGLILGSYPAMNAMAAPLVSFFRFVPVSAFVPLMILWFGIGELQKIILIFIGVSFYLLAFTIVHVQKVRQEYIDSARTLGAGTLSVIWKIEFPATYKQIYDSIRTLFGGGWTLIVLAELVAAQKGVGKVIIDSQRFLHTDRLIAAIVVVGLIGYLFDYLFDFFEKYLFPWESTT